MAPLSAASSQQRTLTMMEELEKLEQNITMTLQEIDHNFSRAHRIITSQILPVIDDYAKHSESLWESSKFWKQFFEASANVSLNSYEEATVTEETATELETTTTETGEPSTSSYLSTPTQITGNNGLDFATPANDRTFSTIHGDESPDFDTPRFEAQAPGQPVARVASYTSPYEKIRREVQGSKKEPTTPSNTIPNDDDDDSPSRAPASTVQRKASHKNNRTPANDPLMHRILDKTYRIQATPHSQVRLPTRGVPAGATAATPITGRRMPQRGARVGELDSSPMMEAPKLNSEIFTSPYKAPRVPGVSIMTPAKQVGNGIGSTALRENNAGKKVASGWDSESDDDGLPDGYSPPKTMQFHIPQSRLLQTPAQEASRRIVNDLLAEAGGDLTDDSPSIVGSRAHLMEDDTF